MQSAPVTAGALSFGEKYDNDRPNMGIGAITPAMKLFPQGTRSDKMDA